MKQVKETIEMKKCLLNFYNPHTEDGDIC